MAVDNNQGEVRISLLRHVLVVTAFTQILDGGDVLTSVVETPLQYPYLH